MVSRLRSACWSGYSNEEVAKLMHVRHSWRTIINTDTLRLMELELRWATGNAWAVMQDPDNPFRLTLMPELKRVKITLRAPLDK
jgi:hypothetical protein